jgi:hypothetical protein
VSKIVASVHSAGFSRNVGHRFGKNDYQSFYALLSSCATSRKKYAIHVNAVAVLL